MFRSSFELHCKKKRKKKPRDDLQLITIHIQVEIHRLTGYKLIKLIL